MTKATAGRPRPLSPHLQVWRWHVTMLASILNRASGAALYAGAVLIGLWLAAAAFGMSTYAQFLALGASPVGLVIWIGLTWSAIYHMLSGIRHLIWDAGIGLAKASASSLSALSIWLSVILTAGFWIAMFIAGKVAL